MRAWSCPFYSGILHQKTSFINRAKSGRREGEASFPDVIITTEHSRSAAEEPSMHILESKPKKLLTRTSYRRKATKQEWRERREQERHVQEQQIQHLLKDLPKDAGPGKTKVLVDAYNIMNLSPKLKAFLVADSPGGAAHPLAFARGELERRVIAYANAAQVDLLLVYDALGSGRGVGPPRIERLDKRVSLVFSSNAEADSYLVKEAQRLKSSGWDRVEIVSKDHRVMMECSDLNDFVIYAIDADQFVKDLEDCISGNGRRVGSQGSLESQAQLLQQHQEEAAASSLKRESERQELCKVAPADELLLLWELECIKSDEEKDLLDPLKMREDWLASKEESSEDEDISLDLDNLFSKSPRKKR